MNNFANLSAENSMHALALVASNEATSETHAAHTTPRTPRNARKAYRASVVSSRKLSAVEKSFNRSARRDFAVCLAPAFRKLWKQIQREVAPIIAHNARLSDALMEM